MTWKDVLRSVVETVVQTASTAEASAEDLNGWLDDLVTAIAADESAAVHTLFDRLDHFFPHSRLGELILGVAVLRDDDDTIAAGVTFIGDKRLLSNQQLIAAMFTAVPDEAHRMRLIEVLANRSWNLDNLLAAIDVSGLADSSIPLLTNITYANGLDLFVQRLLKYSSRAGFEHLFSLVVEGLHNRPGLEVARIVWLALELERQYRDRVLRQLLPLLSANHWLDLTPIIGFLNDQQPSRIERFIKALLDFGLMRWATVEPLLQMPIALYSDQAAKASALFLLIFGALHDAAGAAGAIDAFARAVASWLQRSTGEVKVFAGGGPLFERLRGRGVFEVPMPAWLTGSALKSLSSQLAAAAAPQPNALTPFVIALVSALDALGAAGVLVLMWLGRIPGVFILLLPALLLLAVAIPMKFFEWFGQDIRHLHQLDRTLNIKELPPPGKRRKYMIFSDLHRDASADTVIPHLFDVSHFSANKEIYKRALEYCADNQYIVIENGDCEELWYHPTLYGLVETRVADILTLHADVYDILKALNDQGRYFRTRGNHDNWWVLAPNRLGPLRQIFGNAFQVFDGLIIPDVKDMEQEYLSILQHLSSQGDVLQWVADRLPFGLSPEQYRERKPMFVLHGHQVDFWNCDEHQFLGLVITNAIGVPADGVDALPYYLKGIDIEGNPWMKFADYLTKRRDWRELVPPFLAGGLATPIGAAEFVWQWAPWDNWPPEDVAMAWARQLEFMEETDRRLHDSLSFSETLAASLALVLSYKSAGPFVPCELPGAQLQIAMGHTHNPQSRPYLNFPEPTVTIPTPRGKFSYQVSWIKAPYYNSGTGGWWESVIWAIELTEAGQPMLVYWDRHSFEPQVMSWELHGDPVVKPADLQNLLQHLAPLMNAGATAFNDAVAFLEAHQPFAMPAASGNQRFTFPSLSTIEQYAAAALGVVLTLKRMVCEPSMDPTVLEFHVELPKLPPMDLRSGTLSRLVDSVDAAPKRIVASWFDYFGFALDDRWHACSSDQVQQLAMTMMLTAYCAGSGLLQTLGFMVYICASKGFGLDYRYDRSKGKLALRIQMGGARRAIKKAVSKRGRQKTSRARQPARR